MSNRKWDTFGEPVGGSRWFNGEPDIDNEVLRPVRKRWRCPMEGCYGYMMYANWMWPTGDPGYHHTCIACGFTAAIKGKKYPYIDYEHVDETYSVDGY